ncbi:MAG: Zn-dependent hydrolase [Alphaproteobacteria bacterium]
MTALKINKDRLWNSLMEMAKIGETPKGGVCRLALTDLDGQSRSLFKSWCEEAGMTVSVDRVGNIYARRPGRDPSLAPVVTGSHLDSQPTGGRFDGVYGVLAGLEVVRSLNDNDIETDAPVEVAVWTNEEGSRFSPAMMGSGVFAGAFTLQEILDKTDEDGKRFGDELAAIGDAGDRDPTDHPMTAYFEAHIEQGPILEKEELPIGVVTGGQGQRWYEATVTGMESHAGPTPMPIRKDALVSASKLVQAVNRIGHDFAPNACTTVGHMQVRPNSRNVIPGEVFLTIDMRNPDDDTLSAMDAALRAAVSSIQEEDGVGIALKDFWYFAPTPFDETLLDRVRAGAKAHDLPNRDMVSGAGHDAVYVARKAPTAMIFVPCENGISHNEVENAAPEDIEAGCNVLCHAMMETAGWRKAGHNR